MASNGSYDQEKLDDQRTSDLKRHFDEISSYLAEYLTKVAPESRSSARQKLVHLPSWQFYDLSIDVYDEILRRKNRKFIVLPPVDGFHKERNQARQKLATFPIPRFQDLAGDVHFEMSRRWPIFEKEYTLGGAVNSQPAVNPTKSDPDKWEFDPGSISEQFKVSGRSSNPEGQEKKRIEDRYKLAQMFNKLRRDTGERGREETGPEGQYLHWTGNVDVTPFEFNNPPLPPMSMIFDVENDGILSHPPPRSPSLALSDELEYQSYDNDTLEPHHFSQGADDDVVQLLNSESQASATPEDHITDEFLIPVKPDEKISTELGEGEKLVAKKQELLSTLLSIIFNNAKHYRRLLSCKGDDAQTVLDAFQLLLDTESFSDRGQLIAAMRRLSSRTQLYPMSFFLHGTAPLLEDEPVASGSYADVYKVLFQGEETCFKVIRAYQRSLVERMAKTYAREVIVWGQLSHTNILPFYGLAKFRSRLSFVSPWAENGHLNDYLRLHPDVNRILICLDTAAGIQYLHLRDIVHGDLKGVNILVDRSGRACLGDFGLSSVTDPDIIEWTSQSTMASQGGTVRWQAPELLESEDTIDTIHNTKASDVFAWGNICYEIFTGRLPFFEAARPQTVIKMISRGDTPTRPKGDDAAWVKYGLNSRIWNLMMDCWKFQPSERPVIAEVISRLDVDKPNDDRPPGEWEWRAAMRFRIVQDNNLDEHSLQSFQELHNILSKVCEESESDVNS